MSIFQKLKAAFVNTTAKIAKIAEIFTKKKLNFETLDELEELLLSSDFGAQTTAKIMDKIKQMRFDKGIEQSAVQEELSAIISELLVPSEKQFLTTKGTTGGLRVILFCGVNGSGKTTSIGKLAKMLKDEGNKVMLAACDTFRAAAIDQLKAWSERVGCAFVAKAHGADPASVAYMAIEQAKEESVDVLLLDTAGRLQTQFNLMQELHKIVTVIKKVNQSAPHETVLVLDGTTGQNAFVQVEKFNEIANLTGLIVTKLDGTAKGGVLVGLVDRFRLPIYYLGIGEKMDDLCSFEPMEFANSITGASHKKS